MIIPELITIEYAKAHLRINDDVQDYVIQMKIQAASDLILHYMKLVTVPAEWLIGSPAITIEAPPRIKEATALQTSEFFENREGSVSTGLSTAVKSMLDRVPTVA